MHIFNGIFMNILSSEYAAFFQLLFAASLGMLIGIERVIAHKTAGMRTYALVSMSSCLFIIISDVVNRQYFALGTDVQPMAITAAIITGIGFLGAGLIFFQNHKVNGLTTAAGLWVACGIGVAIGFKMYTIALMATVLTLFVFTVLWFVEDSVRKYTTKVFHDEER